MFLSTTLVILQIGMLACQPEEARAPQPDPSLPNSTRTPLSPDDLTVAPGSGPAVIAREQARAEASQILVPTRTDFECGHGSPDDYEPVYPSNIIDITHSYYFQELNAALARFPTIGFDKYSLAVVTEAFKRRGGLRDVEAVLDVGTGTGAIAIMALAYGAKRAVGTDLDPLAVKNAAYNASNMGLVDRLEIRQVPWEDQGAFSPIRPGERFDLIISDPPQGYDARQQRPYPEIRGSLERPRESFFTSDPGACFLKSFIEGLDEHLSDHGRAWLVMKVQQGKAMVHAMARQEGFELRVVFSAQRDIDTSGKRRVGDQDMPDLSWSAEILELSRAAQH